jgi:L-alanine-DL-glutamate epimerase-like enolase superfamily enzyme
MVGRPWPSHIVAVAAENKMPKMLCRFTLEGENQLVYINPTQVRTLRNAGPGNTRIAFDANHAITVAVALDQVIRDMEAAFESL